MNPSAFSLRSFKLNEEKDEWREPQKTVRPGNIIKPVNNTPVSNRFQYLQNEQNNSNNKSCNIKYIKGDVLASITNGSSIVHCIGQDANVGKDFAKQIDNKFHCKSLIRDQKQVGEVATIKVKEKQY
jgi:hypothetical protein